MLDQLREEFIEYRDRKGSEISQLQQANSELQSKDSQQRSKEERAHEISLLNAQSEMMQIESACGVKLQFAAKRESELVAELGRRSEALKREESDRHALMTQHGEVVEQLERKVASLAADKESKQALKYEAEAMYAKCQILEGQMERLMTENQHIRESTQKELQADFNLPKYLSWRSTFK